MTDNNFLEDIEDISAKLEAEEKRVRKTILSDAGDLEELRSEWQERDSAAERNLREVEWDQYSSLQHELSEIEDARRRLADGTYGICEDCEQEISPKRLAAVPTARKCLACRELMEKEAGISGRTVSL